MIPRFWSKSGNSATSVSTVCRVECLSALRPSVYTASNESKVKAEVSLAREGSPSAFTALHRCGGGIPDRMCARDRGGADDAGRQSEGGDRREQTSGGGHRGEHIVAPVAVGSGPGTGLGAAARLRA